MHARIAVRVLQICIAAAAWPPLSLSAHDDEWMGEVIDENMG